MHTPDCGCIVCVTKLREELVEAKKAHSRGHVKPTHGQCCTCQKCGKDYDSCRCDLDDTIDELEKSQARNVELEKQIKIKNEALRCGSEYDQTVRESQERVQELEKKLESFINAEPMLMSVSGGRLLPINSEGMRALVDENTALEGALEKYGVHDDHCDKWILDAEGESALSTKNKCDCGLDEALNGDDQNGETKEF